MKKGKKFACRCTGVLLGLYLLSAFSEFPLLSDLRDLWIETAMTTGEHQWLAKLYPSFVIEKVMAKQVNTISGIAGIPEQNTEEDTQSLPDWLVRPVTWKDYDPIVEEMMEEKLKQQEEEQEEEQMEQYWTEEDPLCQLAAEESGVDQTGREVLYNDIEQGILISKAESSMYTGYVVQICDPSRVFIASTDRKGEIGTLICDYLDEYDAILGINASGFKDDGGQGLGGEVIGQTRSQGEDWGVRIDQMTIGFNEKDRLLAGQIDDWDRFNLRDAIQFSPVLIKDGRAVVDGSAGWGLQPRTIIAQREDGAVLFLIIDGRKPGYSIGATMGDCAEILLDYNVITAAACDGGSSSVLAYNGEIINNPSTPMTTGRYLPNAFLVKRR